MQKHTSLSNLTHSDRRNHHDDFARAATINAFGWRHARPLDQANFIDRQPGADPRGVVRPSATNSNPRQN